MSEQTIETRKPTSILRCAFRLSASGAGLFIMLSLLTGTIYTCASADNKQPFREGLEHVLPVKPEVKKLDEGLQGYRYYLVSHEKTDVYFDDDLRSSFMRGSMFLSDSVMYFIGKRDDTPLVLSEDEKIGVLAVPQFETLPAALLEDAKELTAREAQELVDQAYEDFMMLPDVRRLFHDNPEGRVLVSQTTSEPAPVFSPSPELD